MGHYKNLNLDSIIEEIDGITYVEEWKSIIGYEALYAISSFGRIKSIKRCIILRQTINRLGYCTLSLNKNGKKKSHLVHRLVAIHFIPNMHNKPQVNHLFGIKNDNRYIKLEWSTKSEDALHAFRLGLRNRHDGENSNMAILNWGQVNEMRRLFLNGESFKNLSNLYPIHICQIRSICKNKNWYDVNYKFEQEINNRKKSKVTPLMYDTIKNLLKDNVLIKDIVKKVGLSPDTVRLIKTNQYKVKGY